MKTKLTIASLALAYSCNAQVHLNLNTWLGDPSLYGGSAPIILDGAPRVALAGQIRATGSGVNLVGYCTDAGYSLNGGWFAPIDLSIAPAGATPSPAWTPGGIQRAAYAVNVFGPLVASNADAVGLQLAVWELLIDPQPSGISGRFQFVHAGAAAIVASIPPDATANGTWWMPVNALGDYRPAQGIIGAELPEPSTWAAGIALLAIGAWRAKR